MRLSIIAPAPIPALTANSIQGMKMAQAFIRQGHDVQVLAPGRPSSESWDSLAEHYGISEKIDIQWLPKISAFRGYDFALRALARAGNWGAGLIYTRHPQSAALASGRGIPVIFELHDLPSGLFGPRLLRAFLRGKGARRLVVITRALAEALGALYAIPQEKTFTLVAPDGVDLERYTGLPDPPQARAELGLPEGFTAGYTGHFYGGRGIDLILDLARAMPRLNFLLVGGRPADVEKVRKQLEAKNLSNVILTGFVPNARLPRYQAACDVLLMPYQGKVAASSGGDIAPFLSPMKMFEYLASGRPIMASDLPVLREVLDDHNALILPRGDLAAWKKTLKNLLKDVNRCDKLADAARKTAMLYTWEKRAERILAGIGA